MMTWLLEPLREDWVQRALLAAVVVGFANGFLSACIVLRRLALMADALSHSLLPGVALSAIYFGLAPLGLFCGAVGAAALVALGGLLVSRSTRLKDETAIAALYIVAFVVGIILLPYAKVKVDLVHFLFGDIRSITNFDLWVVYVIGFGVTAALVALQRPILVTLFDPVFGASSGLRVNALQYLLMALMVLTMVASLQTVGVILSFGLLILPGASLYLLTDSFLVMAWGGGLLGLAGSVVGLWISYWYKIQCGPAIVLILGVVFVASFLFSPRYGILNRWRGKHHFHDESLARWKK